MTEASPGSFAQTFYLLINIIQIEMKQVLLILVLLSGFAMSQSAAQANCKPADCKPCPPGCCIVNGCVAKGSAASVTNQPVDIAFASLMIEDVSTDKKACTMSRKEMKACIAACKNQNSVSIAPDCKPTPGCISSSSVHSIEQKACIQKL
jgi:hypothetical protein